MLSAQGHTLVLALSSRGSLALASRSSLALAARSRGLLGRLLFFAVVGLLAVVAGVQAPVHLQAFALAVGARHLALEDDAGHTGALLAEAKRVEGLAHVEEADLEVGLAALHKLGALALEQSELGSLVVLLSSASGRALVVALVMGLVEHLDVALGSRALIGASGVKGELSLAHLLGDEARETLGVTAVPGMTNALLQIYIYVKLSVHQPTVHPGINMKLYTT